MKIQLNFNKPDNYAFFCPVSKVHLTRSHPVDFVDEVTPYIKRGLKSEAIIDVTETTGQKENNAKQEPIVESKKAQEPTPDPLESLKSTEPETVEEQTIEEPKEETPVAEQVQVDEQPKKKGRKGSK